MLMGSLPASKPVCNTEKYSILMPYSSRTLVLLSSTAVRKTAPVKHWLSRNLNKEDILAIKLY